MNVALIYFLILSGQGTAKGILCQVLARLDVDVPVRHMCNLQQHTEKSASDLER